MSTSGTSPYEENAQEIAFPNEQMLELMRMVQQLVVGRGQNSSSHSQGGPRTENENKPPLEQD